MTRSTDHDQQLRRYWDKHASSYDQQMGFFDRHLFRDSRRWICSQAVGEVLEVAIGTGLNLAHYPDEVRLTGIEWSRTMLDLARRRAEYLNRTVDLRLERGCCVGTAPSQPPSHSPHSTSEPTQSGPVRSDRADRRARGRRPRAWLSAAAWSSRG